MVPEVQEKLEARAQELGIWGVDVPESLGGLGMGLLARAIIWEETGRTIAFPRRKKWIFGPDVSPLLAGYANDQQTEKYLKPCIEGKLKPGFAQTEPDAGGDPAGMKLRRCATEMNTSSTVTNASSPAPIPPISFRSSALPTRKNTRGGISHSGRCRHTWRVHSTKTADHDGRPALRNGVRRCPCTGFRSRGQ